MKRDFHEQDEQDLQDGRKKRVFRSRWPRTCPTEWRLIAKADPAL